MEAPKMNLSMVGRKTVSKYFKKKKEEKIMSIKKNKFSTCKVLNKKGNVVGYLSTRDEENGLDQRLDLNGYTIVAL